MEKPAEEGMNPPRGGLSTIVKPVDVVVAQYDYNPLRKSQLRFFGGDIIYVISKSDSGWWDGIIYNSRTSIQRGWFPRSFTKSIKDTSANRRVFSMNANNNPLNSRPSSHGSRRNSLRMGSPSANMNVHSASGSRRGSLVNTGNIRRKSLSSTFQDGHDMHHNNAHMLFSSSPSNSTSSMNASGSSHLKQDFQFDMSRKTYSHSRKPSVTSSSRSGSSTRSQNVNIPSMDPLQKDRSPSESRQAGLSNDSSKNSISSARSPHALFESEINVLSSKEVEMLLNNMSKQDFVPVWTPVLTENKNLLYYNYQLNVYCTSLPLSGTPELNLKSVFPPNEHLVDLKERKLDPDAVGNTQMMDLESLASTSEKKMKMSGTSASVNPMIVIGPSSTAGTPPPFKNSSSSFGVKTDRPQSTPDLPTPQTEQSAQTDNSDERIVLPQMKKTILSNNDWFYSHNVDIKSWTELKNSTVYFLKAAHSFFFKYNQASFHQNFSSATTFIFYHQLACKLSRQDLVKNNVLKDIRKILKKLIKSLFRINVNATLYFSSNNRVIINQSDVKGVSTDGSNYHRESLSGGPRYSSTFTVPTTIEFPDLRNVSTSTANSFGPGTSFDGSQTGNRTSETVQLDTSSPRTSVPTNTTQTSNIVIDEETGIVLSSLLNVIQIDFSNIFKLINKLHTIISHSVAKDDVLPQIYPRFIKGSFDGAIWIKNESETLPNFFGNDSDNFNNFESRFIHTPIISESMSNSLFSARQYSNTSSKTFHSNLEKQYSSGSIQGRSQPKSRSYSKDNKTIRYPLCNSTLSLLREKLSCISTIYKMDKSAISKAIETGKRVELSMSTYNGLKESTVFLNVVERLDLQFFLNLKRCRHNKELDQEFQEFCESSMTNVVSLLLEFYDLKQSLHDITIRYVMDSQHLSLRDPFVFSSMRGELSQSSKENDVELYHFTKADKITNLLSEKLISQDVEVNGMSFLDTREVLHEAAVRYFNIATLLFQIIEQLIVERENIINYAARMMNNDFIDILLKDEQVEEEDLLSSSVTSAHRPSEEIDILQHPGSKVSPNLMPSTDTKSPTFLQSSFIDELPWFLDSEHESDLQYSTNGHIKGGTKNALIEHLTNHKTIDAFFNIAMLTTFRSIFTTTEFLRYLYKRFELSPPEGLSYEEYNIWVERKQKPIQIRVINIIKAWLTDYWSDTYYEDSLEELCHIVDMAILEEIPGAADLKPIVKNRVRMRESRKQNIHREVNQLPLHRPVSKSTSSKTPGNFRLRKLKLLDFDPLLFAQQLTLDEHILYSRIDQFECLDRIWHKKYCDFGGSINISNFITSSNHLTNFVSYCIVKEGDIQKRAQVMEFFIHVSEHCFALKNFSSMTAIVSALYSSPIFRLKKTINRLSKDVMKSLDKLNTLMDSTKNFFRYRDLLKTVHDVACVPFFGVYLSDLTFTVSGNPDYLNNNPNLINFSKRLKIVTILNEIMSFQKITYKLKYSDDVKSFLENEMENVPSIEKQYEQSLRIEPRVDVSLGINNAEYNTTVDGGKSGNRKLRFGRLRK